MSSVDNLAERQRPKRFKQIVGQTYGKKVCIGSLKQNKIPRTMLFGGPHGTGKTTFALLYAAYINCQKRKKEKTCLDYPKKVKAGKICDSCKLYLAGNHPDIHELNIADQRKIDNVRDMLRFVDTTPTFNYRVFILDECQEYLPASWRALNKPLEKPPASTVWLLASMEPDAIPDSVLSRCTIIPIELLSTSDMKKVVKRTAKKEKKILGKKAISWIISMSGNHPRDAISLCDGIFHYMAADNVKELKKITDEIADPIINSGIMGTAPTALVILSLLYVQSPLVFAYMQKGVTPQLVKDLYNFQDNYIAHSAYGNSAWKWKSALKAVSNAMRSEINISKVSLPIKLHIKLNALLGIAYRDTRTMGNAGVALRQACSEWWFVDIEEEDEE